MLTSELLLHSDPAEGGSDWDSSTHELATDCASVHVEGLANDSQRCTFRVLLSGVTNIIVGELANVLAADNALTFEVIEHSGPAHRIPANELADRKTVPVVADQLVHFVNGQAHLVLALPRCRGSTASPAPSSR